MLDCKEDPKGLLWVDPRDRLELDERTLPASAYLLMRDLRVRLEESEDTLRAERRIAVEL